LRPLCSSCSWCLQPGFEWPALRAWHAAHKSAQYAVKGD
jgi:hypothetical protein